MIYTKYKIHIIGLLAMEAINYLESQGYINIEYSFKDNCYTALLMQ